MKLAQFSWKGETRLGFLREEEVIELKRISSFNALIEKSIRLRKDPKAIVLEELECQETNLVSNYDALDIKPNPSDPYFSKPLEPPEIWAAGVTYLRSRKAREVETHTKGVYDKVYDAVRPELFFKGTGSRCVGPNEPICIRSDSRWSVPEAELTLVLGSGGKIIGYTLGNDVTARDIEGENPLYLPQAKIHRGSCSIGPIVALANEEFDPRNAAIDCRVLRNGSLEFEGKTSISSMKRSFEDLIQYLVRDNVIPPCALLMTGTGIVPPDEFSLRDGDLVEISVQGVGVLRNPVKQL